MIVNRIFEINSMCRYMMKKQLSRSNSQSQKIVKSFVNILSKGNSDQAHFGRFSMFVFCFEV